MHDIQFKLNIHVKSTYRSWINQNPPTQPPRIKEERYNLSGIVEMYSLNELRLHFDFESMKIIIDSLVNNKNTSKLFEIPIDQDKFYQNIVNEYVMRAQKIIGKHDDKLCQDEIDEKIVQLYKGYIDVDDIDNDDNDEDEDDENEDDYEEDDDDYEEDDEEDDDTSVYFHDKYESLCLKYNVKPLGPYVGTDRWLLKLNKEKNAARLYFGDVVCCPPVGINVIKVYDNQDDWDQFCYSQYVF